MFGIRLGELFEWMISEKERAAGAVGGDQESHDRQQLKNSASSLQFGGAMSKMKHAIDDAIGASQGIMDHEMHKGLMEPSTEPEEALLDQLDMLRVQEEKLEHLFNDANKYHDVAEKQKMSKETALGIGVVAFVCLTCINVGMAAAGPEKWQHMFYSACFGPFGGCLRWELGLRNKHASDFKLWTFMPNVLAAGLTVMLGQWSHVATSGGHLAAALSTGFSGSLSTVSTLVLEVNQLCMRSHKAAFAYAIGTFFCAQVLCLIVQVIRHSV